MCVSVLNTFLRKFRKHWYIPSNAGSRSFHIFFLDATGVSNQSDWRELSRWGLQKQTEEENYDSDVFFSIPMCNKFQKYNSYSQIKLLWILWQSKWSIMIDHNRSLSGKRINLISVNQSCFFILVPVMFLICSSTIVRETEAAKVDLKYKKHNWRNLRKQLKLSLPEQRDTLVNCSNCVVFGTPRTLWVRE